MGCLVYLIIYNGVKNRMGIITKYIKSILWSIVIIVLCFTPGDRFSGVGPDIPYFDKFVHFIFFFVLSFILQYEAKNVINLKHCLLILLYAVILGGFIELIQEYLISGRSGEIFDLEADVIGAVMAFVFFKSIKSQ